MFASLLSAEVAVALFTYFLFSWLFFACLYLSVGFTGNFSVPEGSPSGPGTPFYYAFAVQTNIGAGEISPKTSLGRALLNAQQLLAFAPALALLAPWFQ